MLPRNGLLVLDFLSLLLNASFFIAAANAIENEVDPLESTSTKNENIGDLGGLEHLF